MMSNSEARKSIALLLFVVGANSLVVQTRPLIASSSRVAVPYVHVTPFGLCGAYNAAHSGRSSPTLGHAASRCSPPRCSGSPAEPDKGKYRLYSSRWVQLGYLSLLALLSDWVCFSVAAAPETWEEVYNHDPATLIDIFLFTNVVFCLLEPTVVRRAGLRTVIVVAALLMSTGCLLRSGIPFTGAEPEYAQIIAGTVLVGAAQPFFQCTPPLLSATWFGSEERALSTAIAINFNQVGIATAFLVGGAMATTEAGLSQYFDVITACCIAVSIGAFVQFQERPPTAPSASAAARLESDASTNLNDVPNFFDTARMLLATPGFVQPLIAFVASIAVSNVVSAFIEETLKSSGIVEQNTIDLAGAGFQAAIVLGGIVLGGYVDRTKRFKQVTLACFVAALFLLQPVGLGECPQLVVLIALLGLGAVIGPVQPINAELAVEVAYPADENSIEALQQLCGNLFSALLVPVAEIAARTNVGVPGGNSISGDSILLSAIVVGATAYYSTFNSVLKRSALDCAGEGDEAAASCEVVLDFKDEGEPTANSPLSFIQDGTSASPSTATAATDDK